MHPFSVAEAAAGNAPGLPPEGVVRQPRPVAAADFDALWRHGGYPEPFLRRDARFTRRWQSTRAAQRVREDVRELTGIQQRDQLEVLVRLLAERSGEQLVFGNLARQVRVAADTVRRWVATLSDLHLGFLVRPWFKNVSRSLRKEPKWFLRDWAAVRDAGQRAETFVACHLLKAVEGWNDMGLGAFELGYLRDKEQREVDFVVVRDGEPWFLVEAKHEGAALGANLRYFQQQLGAPFAFQATVGLDYVDADCFAAPGHPLVVPAPARCCRNCSDFSASRPAARWRAPAAPPASPSRRAATPRKAPRRGRCPTSPPPAASRRAGRTGRIRKEA